MIYLLNSLPNQSVRHYDVCVVGTGPAGMTLALEYIRSSSHTSRVAVLESGYPGCGELYRQGFDFACKATIQTIYQGEVNGWIQRSRPHYLVNSRLRYLGGTSNVWGGWCWPLERFDIEERPTRPGAVWPVTYDELLPYYERAQRICELGTIAYDSLEYWIQLCQLQMLSPMALDETELRTRIVQFHALNFWERYKSLLASSPSVDVYCNANLIRLINEPEEPGRRRVDAAIVRSVEDGEPGRTVSITADRFVLALGAIETTRILLLSDLGTNSGQLGRNFLEHPFLWGACKFILAGMPHGVHDLYFAPSPILAPDGNRFAAALVPTPELLEREGIGTFRVMFGRTPGRGGVMNLSWEQIPNLNSCMYLSNRLPPDIFGQPRLELHPQVLQVDSDTLRRAIQLTSEMLQDAGYIRDVHLPPLVEDPWQWSWEEMIVPGYHPMGTTRMSYSPDDGVVDTDCRVHETTNLYVASSSVFPTTGYANPTLTIVALAIRLADHLKGVPRWISHP